MPYRKGRSARAATLVGMAGAVTVLVVFVAGQFGVEIPSVVASALTTVFAGLAALFTSGGD